MSISYIDTDILIIGGGAAGCFAAVEIYKRAPTCKVVIMEKAHIERSGCLAMGLNAINAYLHAGQTPDSYVSFVERHFEGIIRRADAEIREFGELWHERVKAVLMNPLKGMFIVREL
jgi:adenylylsulfate reductase subunit A